MGAAYTNPDTDPATGTTLYDIEAAFDVLVIQNPPEGGTLNTVGPLNTNFAEHVGFDIAPDKTAYASFTAACTSNNFFRVNLSTGAVGFGVGSIGLFQLDAGNYTVNEDAATLTVTVNRTGGSNGSATVNFSTSNGTASDRSDYTYAAGTLEFASGEASKTIPVLISEDSYVEGTETLTVTLSKPTGGGGLGSQAVATLVIIDEPSEPASNPIDDSTVFVRQHYHDFLNRDADAEGEAHGPSRLTPPRVGNIFPASGLSL